MIRLDFIKKINIGRNGKRSARYLMIVAAVIYALCVAICIWHVSDVRNGLEQQTADQFAQRLSAASTVVSGHFHMNTDVTDAIAGELAKMDDIEDFSEDVVLSVMKKYNGLEDIGILYFMFDDATAICEDGRQYTVEDAVFDMIAKSEGNTVFYAESFLEKDDLNKLYVVTPVSAGEAKGWAVAVVDCQDLLLGDAFKSLCQTGDLFLTDMSGNILAKTSKKNNKASDIYNYLQKTIGSDSRSLNKLKIGIASVTLADSMSGAVTVGRVNGANEYVTVEPVEGVEGIKLLYQYSGEVFLTDEKELIVRTLASVIILIVILTILFVVSLNYGVSTGRAMTEMAYRDDVTGGKNLNYFKQFVADRLKTTRGIPYAMQRFDISNFRFINEAYGHVKADALLKALAEEVEKILRAGELCVRMNADQFVAYMRNDAQLEERMFLLSDQINARALDIGIKYPIKLKRGVYKIPDGESDVRLLIDRANAARKDLTGEEQSPVAYYSDKIVKDMHKVDKIESEMEAALFNNEFKMFIQPKWDIVEDHLYGGEALVRWVRDDGSMVYPNDFIPVFERNGFIEQLDMFMLESVCRLLKGLKDQGKKLYPISVNQSRVLLHNPNYIEKVSELLQKYEIPHGMIELEVTETVFFLEKDKMGEILSSLKAHDVELSMDDFGSGYSSLNMLKDFPFDVLKIDKEFFSESTTSESSIVILTKIIEMARGLNIRVICEGVETEEQIELLRRIGCHYVQGYFYSKPIPNEEFVERYCLAYATAEELELYEKTKAVGTKRGEEMSAALAVQRQKELEAAKAAAASVSTVAGPQSSEEERLLDEALGSVTVQPVTSDAERVAAPDNEALGVSDTRSVEEPVSTLVEPGDVTDVLDGLPKDSETAAEPVLPNVTYAANLEEMMETLNLLKTEDSTDHDGTET
ncbi:MAG: GGDEF domain-containing phosphodiesterase [Lachnospiraceae bacterium]|nr:GGDEF domain-containing phosphodiesterase [Lachnospiraceae bacterium]